MINFNKSAGFDIRTLSNIQAVGSIETISFPTSDEEIQKAFHFAKEKGLKPYILGGGSNTLIGHLKKINLISDRKFKTHWEIKDDLLIVSSNIFINFLITRAAQNRLYGLEFLAGIPAHIGGLVCMNAGAYEKNISDFIEWISVVDDNGEKIIHRKDLDFRYRHSNIPGFITKVCLKMYVEENNDFQSLIKNRIEHFIKDREAKHPMNMPSLGCFFKNTEKYPAGYLIEQAGLKSFQIGGAMVSPKHANFLVNVGNAKFEDFIDLIDHVKKTVFEKFDIELELEVKILNE